MSVKNLITGESLSSYFYKNLDQVNKSSLCPLPQEFIWYSSEVLNSYALSDKFFEATNGKVHEKLLGVQLLEAQQKNIHEKKAMLKDIGDTTLVQLGFFSDRVNSKNLPEKYYINIGKTAYNHMESLNCTFYDIPNFFNLLATSYENIIRLLTEVKKSTTFENFNEYLLFELDTEKTKVS